MKKIKFLALIMSALLSVNSAWGADITLTIEVGDFTGGSSSAYTVTSWSSNASDGTAISGSSKVILDETAIRFKKSYIYNSTKLPGAIKQIRVIKASGSNRSVTAYVSPSALTSATGTNLGSQNLDCNFQLTDQQIAADNRYFYLNMTTDNAYYISSIEIVMEAASSCEEPTVLTDDGACQTNTDYDLAENCFLSENTSDVTFTCTSSNESSCTISGSTFRATAAGTYTIKATQAEDGTYCAVEETFNVVVTAPTCYVTFLNNSQPISGTGIDAQGRKQYHEGDQLGELPTLDEGEACDEYSNHFMGWYAGDPIRDKRTEAPTLVTSFTTVNGDMTLRAVWAKEQ